jgi:AcrR family transcriptional regulator
LLRQAILDAAVAAISESGSVRTLSLRGVARSVGIAATSVYLHFSDIDSLARAVVDNGFEELDRAREAATNGVSDPVLALMAGCGAYGEFATTHGGLYRVMFDLESEANPSLAKGFSSPRSQQSFDRLVESIRRCRASDVPRIESRELALLLWASLHGLVSLRISRPRLPWPDLRRQSDELVALLVTANHDEAATLDRLADD